MATVAQTQYLKLNCDCGSRGGQYLEHWQVLRCKCGKCYWALQPDKGGPLKLFPHPGYGNRSIRFKD